MIHISPVMTTTTTPSPLHRILCLHGYRQDGTVFHAKVGALRRALRSVATLHCVDAPHKGPSRLSWWNSTDDGSVYRGYEESIEHVIRVNERDGPFDGILGFSQGGVFASILAGLAATRLQSLRYVIMLSAFPARATDITAKSWYNEIELPSLHVWGTGDSLVPPQASELLRNRFVSPVTYTHDKGHVIPGNSAFTTAVSSFISSHI